MTDSKITEEKRSSSQPTAKELEAKLSIDQRATLRRLESFGWSLIFIRLPLSQASISVVTQGNEQAIGILEEDGRLNIDVDIDIRKEA